MASTHLKEPGKHRVEIDWKLAAGDVLGNLRMKWGRTYPALYDDVLDQLAINYATEAPDIFIPALGQELSSLGLRLYNLPSNSDAYHLVIIEAEEEEAFAHAAKTTGASLELQSRRKAGQQAKRLDVIAEIEHQQIRFHNYGLEQAGDVALVERWQDKAGGWLPLGDWPPVEIAMAQNIKCHRVARSPDGKHFAVAFSDKTSKIGEIRIGEDPEALEHWERLEGDEPMDALSVLAFVGNDLLVAYKSKARIVRDVASGNRALEAFAEEPEPALNYPYTSPEYPRFVTSGDGRQWLILSARLIEIRNGEAVKTAMRVRETSSFDAAPTPDGFAYCLHDGTLVELNVATGEERVRKLSHLDGQAKIVGLADGWNLVTRWGSPARKVDLLQLWRPVTDQWLRLPYGALGKHGISDMLLTSKREVWASNNAMLFNLGQLDAFMTSLAARLSKSFQQSAWGEWSSPAAAPATPTAVTSFASEPGPAAAAKPESLPEETQPGLLGRLFGAFRR